MTYAHDEFQKDSTELISSLRQQTSQHLLPMAERGAPNYVIGAVVMSAVESLARDSALLCQKLGCAAAAVQLQRLCERLLAKPSSENKEAAKPQDSAGYAVGWAVVGSDGVPLVSTVTDSPRAAMVNWLVAEYGMLIMDSDTDAFITDMFDTRREDCVLAQVHVHVMTPVTTPAKQEEKQ